MSPTKRMNRMGDFFFRGLASFFFCQILCHTFCRDNFSCGCEQCRCGRWGFSCHCKPFHTTHKCGAWSRLDREFSCAFAGWLRTTTSFHKDRKLCFHLAASVKTPLARLLTSSHCFLRVQSDVSSRRLWFQTSCRIPRSCTVWCSSEWLWHVFSGCPDWWTSFRKSRIWTDLSRCEVFSCVCQKRLSFGTYRRTNHTHVSKGQKSLTMS